MCTVLAMRKSMTNSRALSDKRYKLNAEAVKSLLLFENEIHCQYQKTKSDEVIDAESLGFENDEGKDRKDQQRNDLLDHLELKEAEGAAVAIESDTVCRYLKGVLKQGNAPADKYDADETQIAEAFHVFELEVPVPCQCHECIGNDKQYDGDECSLHFRDFG
jgi:hypothetical protein